MNTTLGATWLGGGRCRFRVWAPLAETVDVRFTEPSTRVDRLVPDGPGYHEATLDRVSPGDRYVYQLSGSVERPDPASRYQPEGVHGPSEVVDPAAFAWTDAGWRGIPIEDYVFYELHVGTFTPEGTFDAVIPRLDELKRLGITSIEILPVAQFPGDRNWGYDGAFTWAVQNSYGGPEGLRRLVDTCHARGLAVTLDVVYNHLGPEGNYLGDYGHYFSHAYRNPWGEALNFDGSDSDEVRRYFIENALYWIAEFHVDAFRLDAIQGIKDASARPFLAELADAVHRASEDLGRPVHVIAESDLNDARVVTPESHGGFGHDAMWTDDFHHSLHAALTGESFGYYADFSTIDSLRRAIAEGQAISGDYSKYRRRRYGNSVRDLPPSKLVVYAQNHDQVGNRMNGDRLSSLVPFEAAKLAAGAICLSPNLPLLFMGEEYGETAPFLYFVSHTDPGLVEAVRTGRRADLRHFGFHEGVSPDPQDPATFLRSKLNHELKAGGNHRILFELYSELLAIRRRHPALPARQPGKVMITGNAKTFSVNIRSATDALVVTMNLSRDSALVQLPTGSWTILLNTADSRWAGPLNSPTAETSTEISMPPLSLAVFTSNPGG